MGGINEGEGDGEAEKWRLFVRRGRQQCGIALMVLLTTQFIVGTQCLLSEGGGERQFAERRGEGEEDLEPQWGDLDNFIAGYQLS